MRPIQFFNHYQFNNEITTKSGLCKNMYLNSYPDLKPDNWFPRCYDLSQSGQTDELIDDYQATAIQIIIKKHYKMFKESCKDRMEKAYSKLEELNRLKD